MLLSCLVSAILRLGGELVVKINGFITSILSLIDPLSISNTNHTFQVEKNLKNCPRKKDHLSILLWLPYTYNRSLLVCVICALYYYECKKLGVFCQARFRPGVFRL
jgi:predicted membrane channel-forming protein YqfA (hemolysin III family)